MDSFLINKIAGAALSALLLIFGARTLIQIQSEHHGPAKAGFSLPAPKDAPATASAAAPAAASGFDFAKVEEALAKASAENGQAAFKKCSACHTADKGGANRVGPNLYDIVGRKAGTHAGFAYSDAMKAHGDWTFEALAKFINNPRGVVPGTKMVFAGISDTTELADLLAYMRSLSDSPKPLP